MRRYQLEAAWQNQNWRWVKILFSILLVVVIASATVLWNDGILFFSSETESVQAVVKKISLTPERHNRLYHTVHYTYTFNDSTYTGMEKISFSNYSCNVGDTIEIEVLKRKPEVSRISVE